MIEKTFPSVPISLQGGLGGLDIAERSDPAGPEPDRDCPLLSVMIDSFRE